MNSHFICKKIQAGALYFAVFFSFLIALITSFIITLTFYNKQYINTFLKHETIKDNVESGINLYQNFPDLIPYNSPTLISLFNSEGDTVSYYKQHWGAYDIITVGSEERNYNFQKTFLSGVDFQKGKHMALYIPDEKEYLSVCGSTTIKGDCYISKMGIRSAFIEGQSHTNKKLVEGRILHSKPKLPKIDERFNAYLTTYFENSFDLLLDSIISYEEINNGRPIQNSFQNKTLVLFSKEPVNTQGMDLTGKIVLISARSITISKNSKLNDILIIAPQIKVEDKFEGMIQIFAHDSLMIGENCLIQYPGFAGILNLGINNCYMEIGEDTRIFGGVFIYQEMKASELPLMKVNKKAEIYGQLYCSGRVDLKGSVFGSVLCRSFELETASSRYKNHLLDATINFTDLSKYFAGSDISLEINKMSVIKELR